MKEKDKQEYFKGFTPFKKEIKEEVEPIIEEVVEPVFEEQITFEEMKPAVVRVVRRQNIASSPAGNKLGVHEPGEIEILEEKDGWVRVARGWLEKRYLELN